MEWNSLGVWEVSFATFCEGILSNSSLKSLDLRNNQIDHSGAKELSHAIRHNKFLHCLDLRWNVIGLVGGRSLLNAMQHNQSLTKVGESFFSVFVARKETEPHLLLSSC